MGNKNDSPDRKVVLTEDAQRFSDQMGIRLFETSAKDNINVDEVRIDGSECMLGAGTSGTAGGAATGRGGL